MTALHQEAAEMEEKLLLEPSRNLWAQARALYRAQKRTPGAAPEMLRLYGLASVLCFAPGQRRFQKGQRLLARSIDRFDELRKPTDAALSRLYLARAEKRRGFLDRARLLLREAAGAEGFAKVTSLGRRALLSLDPAPGKARRGRGNERAAEPDSGQAAGRLRRVAGVMWTRVLGAGQAPAFPPSTPAQAAEDAPGGPRSSAAGRWSGLLDRAQEILSEALAVVPMRPGTSLAARGLHALGLAHLEQRRCENAEELLFELEQIAARPLDPDRWLYYHLRARILSARQDPRLAAKELTKALRIVLDGGADPSGSFFHQDARQLTRTLETGHEAR